MKGKKKWLFAALLAVGAIAPLVAPPPIAALLRAVVDAVGPALAAPAEAPVEYKPSAS